MTAYTLLGYFILFCAVVGIIASAFIPMDDDVENNDEQ